MPALLKLMLNEFEAKSNKFWNEILTGEANLTDEEAIELNKTTRETRTETGFRE